ncbi:type IV pilin-like G/H family protein [Laspinema sp. A4]|uniref:type IV pilin-like G/H family protein n=1 Tax=Laspinema sp. D2d TaxID=2953686 RepID=UPI0021BB532A|nr:type IV pilin-like G/H family protein [Laspinema sp. D2d]MCT7982744.1 type IV pilin-like G/H family protein [Laspinema sp. D2d]
MSFLNLGKVVSTLLVSSVVAGLTLPVGSNYAQGNPAATLQNYVGTWITLPQSRDDQTEFISGSIQLERLYNQLTGSARLSGPFGGFLEIIPNRQNGNKLEGNLYIMGLTNNVIIIPVKVELIDNNQNLKLVLLMTEVEEYSLPQEFTQSFPGEITAEDITVLFRRWTDNEVRERSLETIEVETAKNIYSMIRSQQAYFRGNNRFTLNLSELGVGIPSETESFSYQINSIGDRGVQILAIPKQNQLNSYTGGVFRLDNADESGNLTVAIVCESEQPSTNPPSPPQLIEQTPQCPRGFWEVPR